MITLDMTDMTDAQKVEALTVELGKVLDDGTKASYRRKTLRESFEALQESYANLQAKYHELEAAKNKLEIWLTEKETVIKRLERDQN